MVNQNSSTSKPAPPAVKPATQNSRYSSSTVSTALSPAGKAAAAKGVVTHQTSSSDVRSSAVKELQAAKPVFVFGSSTHSLTSAPSNKMQSKKHTSNPLGHVTGDSSPAVAKPGEPNKRTRLSTAALTMSTTFKRPADKINDVHSKLSASMTSMKAFATSNPTPSKLRSSPGQSMNGKVSASTQKGDEAPPLSSSSTKSQIGAARSQSRALQLANPQPAQSIDISRSSPGTRLTAKLHCKTAGRIESTPSKSLHTRSTIKSKQALGLTNSSVLEGIKATASTAIPRRTKAGTTEVDTDKPSSTRVRKSSIAAVTPMKARSPPAGSLLRSKVMRESESRVGVSPSSGAVLNTGGPVQHRSFPRQSVDYDTQQDVPAPTPTVTPPKPPPPVPRLNLAAVLTQSQELNLPHHQPDTVVSPTAPSPSTATGTAQPSRHSKGSTGSMALGSAPQEDHFYMYKSVTPEERRQWEALIKRLPRAESKQVKKLWDALLDARHNCEGMAFRGHRLLDQMKNDFISYKQEAEKRIAEVEFDRQRLAALLQAKDDPAPRKSKRPDTQALQDQARASVSSVAASADADGSPGSAKSEGHEELEYRARIIATSETAHILMKQLMEKEAIQNDLQNQVTDLQKLVYCLANIAKHLLNDQPPRPSPAHLAQWRDFVHKLLQQAAYQAASGKATAAPGNPSAPAPSKHDTKPVPSVPQNPTVSSPDPDEPPPTPRHRSPRVEPITRPPPISTTPAHKNAMSSSCPSPASSLGDDMDYSPVAPEAAMPPLSPAVVSPVPVSPDLVRQQPFLINLPVTRKSIGSHVLDIDNGPASTGPTSPIDAGASDRSREVSERELSTSGSLSSPDASVDTPSLSEAGVSDRTQSARPAPLFSTQEGPMRSPVPRLRLTTLQLRDKLESFELHSNTDRSATVTAPSSLTTPNSPSQLFYPPLTAVPTPRSPSHSEDALRSHIHSLITSVDKCSQPLPRGKGSQPLLQDNCLADLQPEQPAHAQNLAKLRASTTADIDAANTRKRKGVSVEEITSPSTHNTVPPITAASRVNQCPFPQSNPMFNLSSHAETESGSLQGIEEEEVEREVDSIATSGRADRQLQGDVKALVRQACAKRNEARSLSLPQDLRVNTQLSEAQRSALQAEHAEREREILHAGRQSGLSMQAKSLHAGLSVGGLSPQPHPVAGGKYHNFNFVQQDLVPESPCLAQAAGGNVTKQGVLVSEHIRQETADRHGKVQSGGMPASAAGHIVTEQAAGGEKACSSDDDGFGGIQTRYQRLSHDSMSLSAYTNLRSNPCVAGGHEQGEKKLATLQTVTEEGSGSKPGGTVVRSFRVNGLETGERESIRGSKSMESEREAKSSGMVVGSVTSHTTHLSRLDHLRSEFAKLKMSTEARLNDVDRLVGRGARSRVDGKGVDEREEALETEMAVHDNALVMGDERGRLMMMDSCPLELPLPNSMPGFGIASVRLP